MPRISLWTNDNISIAINADRLIEGSNLFGWASVSFFCFIFLFSVQYYSFAPPTPSNNHPLYGTSFFRWKMSNIALTKNHNKGIFIDTFSYLEVILKSILSGQVFSNVTIKCPPSNTPPNPQIPFHTHSHVFIFFSIH